MGFVKFFNKLPHNSTRFFNKVARDTPKVLNKISVISRKVGNTISQIASNPLVQAGLTAVAPESAPAIMAGLNTASQVAHQTSGLTNTSNYKGNINQVSGNVLEKLQNIQSTVQGPGTGAPIQIH